VPEKNRGGPPRRGPLPPAFFLMALVTQAVVHLVVPGTIVVGWPWRLFGVAGIGTGIALAVIADRQFKLAKTAIHPFDVPSVLITSGAYRLSRNPMYLAMIIVLLGAAVALGTASPFAIPPIFALVLFWRFIRVEEQALVQRFGDRYSDYARHVRRWI